MEEDHGSLSNLSSTYMRSIKRHLFSSFKGPNDLETLAENLTNKIVFNPPSVKHSVDDSIRDDQNIITAFTEALHPYETADGIIHTDKKKVFVRDYLTFTEDISLERMIHEGKMQNIPLYTLHKTMRFNNIRKSKECQLMISCK